MGILDFLLGGSDQESQQSSSSKANQLQESMQAKAPLTPQEVRDYYEWAKSAAGGEPTGGTPPFQWNSLPSSPTFGTPGAAPTGRTLTAGDYDRLESSLSAMPLARLAQDRETAKARFMADARKRGIADDPAFFQLQNETIDTPYGRNVSDVLSNATNQRYNLESSELGRLGGEDVNKYGIQTTAGSNLNQANLGAFNTQAAATGAENTTRNAYNLAGANASRQFWLDKMKSYYSGVGEKAVSASRGTSATTSTGAGTSSGENTGGLLPALSGFIKFPAM